MDTPIPTPPATEADRDDARAARKRWEAEKIAKARRQMEAGQVISGEVLDKWLEQSMATDDPVPWPGPTLASEAD